MMEKSLILASLLRRALTNARTMLRIVFTFPWLKIWLVFGNVMFMIIGIGLIYSSAGIHNAIADSVLSLAEPLGQFVETLSITGCLFSVSAFFGFCGAIYEISWMLFINMSGLCILLMVEASIFLATFVIRDKVKNVINELECEVCTLTMMALIDQVMKSIVLVIVVAFVLDTLLLYAAFKLLSSLKEKTMYKDIQQQLSNCEAAIHPVTPKLPIASALGTLPLQMDFSSLVTSQNETHVTRRTNSFPSNIRPLATSTTSPDLPGNGCSNGRNYSRISQEEHFLQRRPSLSDTKIINETSSRSQMSQERAHSPAKTTTSSPMSTSNRMPASTNRLFCSRKSPDLEIPKKQEPSTSLFSEHCWFKFWNNAGKDSKENTAYPRRSSSDSSNKTHSSISNYSSFKEMTKVSPNLPKVQVLPADSDKFSTNIREIP